MCQPVAENPGRRHLRSAARGDLAVPVTRTVRYGPRNFAVAGPSTWNSLPVPLRSCHLPSSLRRESVADPAMAPHPVRQSDHKL